MVFSSVKSYIRLNVWDWLLCSLISAGLAVNLYAGWEMTDTIAYNLPAVVAMCALIQVFCFAAIYNRKTTICMGIAAIIYLISVIVYARFSGVLADDVNQSGKILILVAVFVNMGVCLASRSRLSILGLLVLGNLFSAGAAFLQFPVNDTAYLIFLFATMMLLLYRVYFVTAVNAVTGKVNFEWYLGQILLIVLVAIIIAACIFTFIIRPLDPPTDELKLIEKLETSQIIQKTGIASIITLPDKDLLSQLDPDNSMTTDQPDEEEDDDSLSDKSENENQSTEEGTIKDRLEDAFAIRYDFTTYTWVALGFLLLLLLILPFVLKEVLRKRWYTKVTALGYDAQAVNLYSYFLGLFRRMDIKKNEGETLNEFAVRVKRECQVFDEGKTEFTELTRIFTSTYYGLHKLTFLEVAAFRDYYFEIRKRVKKETGFFRYILKYFFI